MNLAVLSPPRPRTDSHPLGGRRAWSVWGVGALVVPGRLLPPDQPRRRRAGRPAALRPRCDRAVDLRHPAAGRLSGDADPRRHHGRPVRPAPDARRGAAVHGRSARCCSRSRPRCRWPCSAARSSASATRSPSSASSGWPPRGFPGGASRLLTALTAMTGALGQVGGTVPLSASLRAYGWTADLPRHGGPQRRAGGGRVVRGARPSEPSADRTGTATSVLTDLRLTLSRRGTRTALWAHFTLMSSFMVLATLWGFPYLVEGLGMAPGPARLTLTLTAAAPLAVAPAHGLGRRPPARPARTADRLGRRRRSPSCGSSRSPGRAAGCPYRWRWRSSWSAPPAAPRRCSPSTSRATRTRRAAAASRPGSSTSAGSPRR